MRRAAVGFAVLAGMTIAGPARADILPPGAKGVRLSIQVEAELPKGKALALARTFRGAMVIEPGTAQEVEWHPLGGDLRLWMIDASATKKFKSLRADMKRDELNAIVERGVACHEAFPGVRTIPEDSPESELRWVYKVAFTGESCAATLERTEKLDADGKVLPAPEAATPATPATPTPPPPPIKPAPVNKHEKAASEAPAPKRDASEPAGMCSVASRPDAGALAWLTLLLAAGRRRSRRARG